MKSDFFHKFIFIHTFQWTSWESWFNFWFSIRKSQSQQKTSEKDHISSNTVFLKTPYSFYKPQLTWHWKNMLLQYSQKPLTLQIFQQTSDWCHKNNCTALFLDVQELISQSSLKANVCIFLYIYLRKFCFRDVVSFYLVLSFICYITFLRWLAVWASLNVLQSFILIEIFGNSTIFQDFDTSNYGSKTRKFSRTFWIQG